jgi:tetratricopeptide (TPR) repeat protein
MFEESDEAAAGVASSSMDRAIEKGTKLIVRHSITARPKKKSGSSSKKSNRNQKEYNKWVDDALLMIGKAQVVKHEFRQSIRTFDLLIRDFSYEESKYSALIWKARAYTELKDFNNARIALESYDYDGKAPEKLYGKYMEVYANLLLVQEKYKEAIPFLQNAIEGADNRTARGRYSFILGQIKQLTGDDAGAAIAYAQTMKTRPGYEMAFNAQIKRATILYKNASLDVIKKQIRKMLRDKKNEDFRDQIYYALGKTYLNFEDEPEAIRNFKKSTEVSVDNDYQKTLSFLEIADIYFNKEIFKPAYQHYDSAMTVMAEDFKDYELINERRNSLQLLVEQLDIINNEDSLIMLADMTESERDKFIDDIIEAEKKRIKEEERLKSQEGDEYNGGGGGYQSSAQQAGGGKWYFYNAATKGMGKQEFTRKWGKRKLTDDWRRKEKGMVEMSQDEPDEPGEPG